MVTIWEVIHPTYSQIMSSAAGEWQRALTPPPDFPIALPCKVLHCYRVFASDHLSEEEPLSHFLFLLPVHS